MTPGREKTAGSAEANPDAAIVFFIFSFSFLLL